MDPLVIGFASFLLIMVLIFSGLHVGTSLLLTAIIGFTLTRGMGAAFSTLEIIPYNIVADYNFAVVPLFILMGDLAGASGIVSLFFRGAQAWLGHLRGGLGISVIALSAAIGASTGSALAAASMMTRIAFPEMLKHKYEPAAAAGIIAAVGPLAVLIPPSIFLVFYGIMTLESISKLLLAGLIPGLISAILYMVLMYVMAIRNPRKFPKVDRVYTWNERFKASIGIPPFIIMILTVIGGIYAGIFTPSEAGAAGAIISLLFVLILQNKRSGDKILRAVWASAGLTSMIYFVLLGAMLYGRFMSVTGSARAVIDLIASLPFSPYVIFSMVIVFYIVLGCFMGGFEMLAITLPIVHPLIIALGFDPIWFGVIAVIMVEAGTVTPPFGILVYTVKGLIGEQAEVWGIFKSTLPFVLAMIFVVILLTIWPQITLFLPSLMT